MLQEQRCCNNIYFLRRFVNYYLPRELFENERILRAKQDFLQERAELFFKAADAVEKP